MAPLKLLDLQDELLDRVLLRLPQRDRARSAVVCKRLYQLTVTSPRIYASLQADVGNHPQAEKFMVWLAHKRHLVRHLSLSSQAPDTPDAMRHQVQLDAAFVGAACHPGLVSLELVLSSPVALGGWAASLCGLRFLAINCPSISISASLSQLTRLTSMSLSTFSDSNYFELLHEDFDEATLRLHDGCLPSSLKTLHLASESNQLPPVVYAATQLTQLVAGGGAQLTREGLENLGHLKALCALGLEEPAGLPEALTTLTGLTTLCIQHAALPPGSFEDIAELTGLKELSLRHLALTAVPTVVLNLQQLTYLDLGGNPLAGPLLPASAPLLGQLVTLALPAAVASANMSLLPRLTALTALELPLVADFEHIADVNWEKLLGAAAGVPPLHTLCIDSDTFWSNEERQAALTKFVAARPTVSVKRVLFPQPPGLRPHTWYPRELEQLISQRQ